MKSILSLFAILALAVSVNSGAVKSPVTKANLYLGNVAHGDTLLYSQNVYQAATPNSVQFQDVTFMGNNNNIVSAVRATEVGNSQYANVWVTGGGVGQKYVTLRVQSARGYGYYYFVEVWGH